MPFRRFRGGLQPPHPNETHPRLYVNPFISKTALMQRTVELVADWRGHVLDDNWGMSLNDQLGDCGVAGMNHWQMALDAGNGETVSSWPDSVTLQLYEVLGGYVPGDPDTDNGTNLQDNLYYWNHNPIQGKELLAYAAVAPGTWSRPVRVALQRMFGPLYIGTEIQEAQEDQANEGIPWQWIPGGAIAGGHCYIQAAELSGPDEVIDLTWGQAQPASTEFQWDALAAPSGEMWVGLTAESVDHAGRNEYGYELQQMNEALQSLTGRRNPLQLTTIR